jgi:ElaB/YqjD/DUF883 family membrane-anchored ribosome-binding protein
MDDRPTGTDTGGKIPSDANNTADKAKPALDQHKGDMPEAQRAAGDVLTQAKDVAGEVISKAKTAAGDFIEKNLGEDALKQVAEDLGGQAQDIARRARDQAGVAAQNVYQQGSRAGAYLSQNAQANPVSAVLIAGAIGFGLAYLIHRR